METLLYNQVKYRVVNKKPYIFKLEAQDEVREHTKKDQSKDAVFLVCHYARKKSVDNWSKNGSL